MRLFPAIDMKNGQCVRLQQGRFDDVTVYSNDVAEIAKRFEKQEHSTFIQWTWTAL